jgi:hypothetical protein
MAATRREIHQTEGQGLKAAALGLVGTDLQCDGPAPAVVSFNHHVIHRRGRATDTRKHRATIVIVIPRAPALRLADIQVRIPYGAAAAQKIQSPLVGIVT